MAKTRHKLQEQARELARGIYAEIYKNKPLYEDFRAQLSAVCKPIGWDVANNLNEASDVILQHLIERYQDFAEQHMSPQWLKRHAEAMQRVVIPPKPRRMALIEFSED